MDLYKEIFDNFKHMQTLYLATSQGGRPYVRPVIMIFQVDKFWVATGTEDKKTDQLQANDRFEFCLPIKKDNKNGYIRGYGTASIVKSAADREMIYNEARFIHNYWDNSEHSGFTLLQLDLKEIEYMRPGNSTTETINLK